MEPIEAQALLIRYEAACRCIERAGRTERCELLFNVVYPTEELLAASMERASQNGVSGLARRMCGKRRIVV